MPNLTPFQEALDKLASRSNTLSPRTSAQWAALPTDIRDRAFFVSRNQNAEFLGAVREGISKLINPQTVIREGLPVTEGPSPATVRSELKQLLTSIDYQPEAPGITDLSSNARLNLIINQNVESVQGYGQHLQALEQSDIYPAQELYRVEDRHEPRDWVSRWQEAGGTLYQGRMIAMKGDPIWTAISRFDVPWPPYDFNSGMWIRDISRVEAQDLGLLLETHNTNYGSVGINTQLVNDNVNLDSDLAQALGQSLTLTLTSNILNTFKSLLR